MLAVVVGVLVSLLVNGCYGSHEHDWIVVLQKGRRRHVVPAFGEWNYYYHHQQYDDENHHQAPPEWYAYGGGAAAEACSDVWFRYSPPPRRPTPKKARRPEGRVAPEKAAPYDDGGGKGRQQQQAARAARAYHSGGVAVARTPARGGATCRVVKRPVDADLYQVPPPEFVSRRPRRVRNQLRFHSSKNN
ncbi:Os12g0417300 [Oryza sativa Japonica Group]|uniref:Os12g0417300 protein n=1 Tax=Oryza sativa subsp. japonica TaxID=39947 RepID=A0A0P0Y9H8_ORYSJ|nr:hypothetical protein EE612_059191 [Oryza sativa]BAT16883.1 Os12g0417300 [Oryza sativa Japonica Group]